MNFKKLSHLLTLSALLAITFTASAQDYTTYVLEFCSGTVDIAIYNPMPSGFPALNPMEASDTILIAVSGAETKTGVKTANIYDPLNPQDNTIYGYRYRLEDIPAGIFTLTLGGKPVTGNLNIKSTPHINILTPPYTLGHPGLATCGPPVPVQVVIEDTAFQYIWKKVGDTTNILIPDQSGTIYVPLNTGYKLSVVTGHGCDVHSNTIYKAVERRSFDQEICVVTTDPSSTYNIVVWDKDALPERPAAYLIYRANVLIGSVSADTLTLSEFRDTVNVNAQQYSYYIKTINTCGDTSGVDFTTSPHSPIYLRNIEYNTQGGYCQIDWERYIGYVGGGSNYSVYALDENSTDWVLINQPDDINTFKDFNYQEGRKYQVRLDAHTCESERASYQTVSNIRSLTPTGIQPMEMQAIKVYPNPTTGYLYLTENYDELEISSITGQHIRGYKWDGMELDISDLNRGLYIIRAKKNNGSIYLAKFNKL